MPNPRRTSGKATAALILAIASFVICPIVPAIIALALVRQARQEIAFSNGALDGESLVTAAKIVAIVNLALFGVGVVVAALALLAIAFVGTNASTHFSRVGTSISLIRPFTMR
jgi:hypothetical protein